MTEQEAESEEGRSKTRETTERWKRRTETGWKIDSSWNEWFSGGDWREVGRTVQQGRGMPVEHRG